MRRSAILFGASTAVLLALQAPSAADDGEKILKKMTGGSIDNQLTVQPEDVFGVHFPLAEHSYTEALQFYVPSQRASGLLEALEYDDVDGNLVETRSVAKPLVNAFIYGPAVEVEGTAFAHSFADAFVGISLDDGETWKTVNLSESADQSSFVLGQGSRHVNDGESSHHGSMVSVEIHEAVWTEKNRNFGRLTITGEADPRDQVTIINFDTGEELFRTRANGTTGVFEVSRNVRISEAPARVAGVVEGETANCSSCHTNPGSLGPSPHDTSDVSAPVPVEYPEGSTIVPIGLDIRDYPGGVNLETLAMASAGNKVMVAWTSRFCAQGQPAYAMAWDGTDEARQEELIDKRRALEAHLGVDVTKDLYLTDLFGVAGQQQSINFADEDYPQVGEVPFGCLWTARGVLRPGDDPRTGEVEGSHMVWTKPERLTSGRRDANRIELQAVAGAGFVMTWQEDPEGLRPGQGEGPGEGWSGAIAHPKTDVWYSFLPWDQFNLVEDPSDPLVAVNLADHDLEATGRPQPYVPWAVPMRLTNNDRCVHEKFHSPADPTDPELFSYCNGAVAANYGLQNFCSGEASIPQGQNGDLGLICVNDAGLPNIANTGATRARTSLQGYDSDGDGSFDSAWVIVAMEESKGLGRFAFLPDGTPCDPDVDTDCTADIGKNQWYFSFDMGAPATSATAAHSNGLVQNLVSQGNLLNQPEVDWRTGEFYPVVNTVDLWDFGAYNFDLYDTEIARRSSMLVQSIRKAIGTAENPTTSRLAAIMSWKQGAMNQGGPADTMLRRIVVPQDHADGLDHNPYDFRNMDCTAVGGSGSWILTDGSNPYYPKGICLAPATNLSGVVPDTCVDSDGGAAIDCPQVDFTSSTFGIGDTNPILQGYVQGEGNTQKALTWHQCPSDGVQTSGDITAVTCATDYRTDVFANLKDQSWYNPLDVSKGHRGFLDGDFVMFLYAWSPNWRLNAKGSDRYDLFVRRSFDGGQTWTTTPEFGLASDGMAFDGDGTVTCDVYRTAETGTSGVAEPRVCYAFPAGGAEHARNITQHQRMRITTLDPRYAATGGLRQVAIAAGCVDATDPTIDATVMTCDDLAADALDSDQRDPSRYFMVYETGDNSTVEFGEAEPLDLWYGRAENFGDDYVVWAETDSTSADPTLCYPSNPHGDADVIGTVVENSSFCNEFDRLTTGNGVQASEADLEANSDGSKLYATWTQVVSEGEEAAESDAPARRVWWIDDYIPSDENAWTLPGTDQTATQ